MTTLWPGNSRLGSFTRMFALAAITAISHPAVAQATQSTHFDLPLPPASPPPPPVEVPLSIAGAVEAAALATGEDPRFLLSIAWKESRFDGRARSRLSSARGLFQHTEQTWLRSIKEFGSRHGLAPLAAAIRAEPDGTLIVVGRGNHAYAMSLRFSLRLSALMAAEALVRDRKTLAELLGREPCEADIYLTHLLGTRGALRYLAAMTSAPGSSALMAAGAGGTNNRPLFVGSDGGVLGAAEAHAALRADLQGQGKAFLLPEASALVEIAEAR